MGSRYRRGGEGGFLTHLNILSLTSEIYKKKKNEVHTVMNKVTAKVAKMTRKMPQ